MLEALLDRLRSQPSRTGSVIITLFGDTIAPRGGALSLSAITEIFAAMTIGQGVVRTAISRLTADGWLARSKQGRRSFYRLAPKGQAETDAATPRIYGPFPTTGPTLHLALLEPGTDRTSPGFAPGFAPAAPGVLVGFGPPPPDSLILTIDGDPKTLRRLAERAWKTDALADRYRAFLALIPETSESLDGLNAVVARVLMIHEYRRIALRDPHLPPPLLPPGWPGNVARERCAAWYEALRAPSELWLDTAENERGTLPQATHPRRFNLPNSLMHQA